MPSFCKIDIHFSRAQFQRCGKFDGFPASLHTNGTPSILIDTIFFLEMSLDGVYDVLAHPRSLLCFSLDDNCFDDISSCDLTDTNFFCMSL